MADYPVITIQVDNVLDVDDQTVYIERSYFNRMTSEGRMTPEAWEQVNGALIDNCAFEGEVTLEGQGEPLQGRALICLCGRGEWVSITVRKKKSSSGYKEDEFKSTHFFSPLAESNELLYKELFDEQSKHEGLIIVAGSTGTGKSQVVRGLIYRYLNECLEKKTTKPWLRVPHLITVEDPIEQLAYETLDDMRNEGVDYTPRQKGQDVFSLHDAFLHAKRQTPTLFYIGEVRSNAEWEEIVTFAGEGNLVIATTHANSVIETVNKIFSAMNVRTPAARGQIADRFIGIVHLRACDFEVTHEIVDGEIQHFARKVTLPALWRNTPQGVKALVSDGLGSILPYFGTQQGQRSSSLGRRYFAEELIKNVEENHRDDLANVNTEQKLNWVSTNNVGKTLKQSIETELIQRALRLDLEEN